MNSDSESDNAIEMAQTQCKVKRVKLAISAEEAYSKLSNFDPSVDKWTNSLDKPTGGEMLIFYSTDRKELGNHIYFIAYYWNFIVFDFHIDDWASDGYTWLNNGHRYQPSSSKNQVLNCYYVGRNGEAKNLAFRKNVYLLPNTKTPALVLYTGLLYLFNKKISIFLMLVFNRR